MDRRLGDVPGLDDLPGTSDLLPSDYSVMEVDGTGALTATSLGLGDIAGGPGGGDPFAPIQGWADPQDGPQGAATSDPMASTYMPTVDQGGVVVGGYASGGFDDEQMSNARVISEVGKSLGASARDIQIALMTAIVESGLRNLDYGDRDSVGMFQQRDAWGSREDRLDPAKAAAMFFKGGAGGQRGLLDIKDRNKMGAGEAAQAVQVSAFPDRYAEHEAEAAQLLGAIDSSVGGSDSAYVGPYKPDELLKRAEAIANAGSSDPFFNSVSDGWYRKCQHLVANLSGRESSGFDTASSAWSHFASSGAAHPADGADGHEPPVGAWLYYSGGSAAGHVAVYLGNGKVASTDVFGNGRVGVGDASELTDGTWHLNYLGWAAPWGEGKVKNLPRPATGPTEGERAAQHAQTFLGTPFKWGGEDYDGVDGLGLVKAVYSKLGADVPRDLSDMVKLATPVSIEDARRGDVVGWDAHPELGGAHAGIYLGNGLVLEAGGPGRVVQVSALDSMPDAFSIPIRALTQHSSPASQPIRTTQIVPGTTSVVEPHAYVPSHTRPAKPHPRPIHTTHLSESTSVVEPHASIPNHTK